MRREEWRWTKCGSKLKLSDDGLVATMPNGWTGSYYLVTGGAPMSTGRHYWEMKLKTRAPKGRSAIAFGVELLS